MDLLNIGTGELLVLALIGLLLFGPEDLLKFARILGGYVHQARQVWADVSTSLETDLLSAETSLRDTIAPPAEETPGATDPPSPTDHD